ncbi:hypothetical protein HYALB_00003703 [Hymenoscyphus albidus]|uniref:Alkaline phosphatase n=1 Tax=Hymenoscyphus albidus TaxID=595503 RepID=A0A9N9LEK8_9HELO|nr:hypothetical protein HYALB_00003703 [Hymenoscyphus albidus]
MPSTRPLFVNERQDSEDRDVDEDTALLGKQGSTPAQKNWAKFWREFALFTWASLATAAVIVLAVYSQHQQQRTHPNNGKGVPKGKRNLIFMVSDGMGPASLSLTRSFRQFQDDLPIDDILVLDQHFIGSSRTRSSNSLVTDSAAGATAFSCGSKSYNGAISMLPDHSPCGTVLEAAQRAGYKTGLVVTTSVTDATPACFAAHAHMRSEEDLIARQEVGDHPLGRVVDLILGGGRCHFLPNSTSGSCRGDDDDITKLAQEKYGWNYIDDREGFDGLELGNELDRRNLGHIYPTLEEMTQTALTALEEATRDSEQGFFLMIEGSRIDHAGHANDPAAQVHEVMEYDRAFEHVLGFLDKSSTNGILIATSDHETGGLAVARQLKPPPSYPQYVWLPEVLGNASSSAENSYRRLLRHVSAGDDNLENFIREELVRKGLGITDATDVEIQSLIDNPELGSPIFADMISRRAQIGWSTHGHTAVDVNIYGSRGSHALRGNHENIEVGKFLRDYLNVDVQAITDELADKSKSFVASGVNSETWAGKLPSEESLESMKYGDGVSQSLDLDMLQ